jgi:hypothetical protein
MPLMSAGHEEKEGKKNKHNRLEYVITVVSDSIILHGGGVSDQNITA